MSIASTSRSLFVSLARLGVIALLLVLGLQPAYAERKTTYYHTDALGSVVAASDSTGALLWRKEYAPYGQQLDSTAENEKVSYTGKEYDDVTGLTYFGARYYDPQVGRFMGVDPAGINVDDPFTFNRYAYANNNPFRFIDPDGRQATDTSCDETCQYDIDRQRATRGARIVREGSGELADGAGQILKEEASNPWNWIPFARAARGLGWQNQLFKNALKPFNPQSKLTNAGRALTKHPELVGATKDTFVALRVNLDKTAELRKETSSA
jgi:RHS repeat-associated protein